jgi:importin subunit alpha-6/7
MSTLDSLRTLLLSEDTEAQLKAISSLKTLVSSVNYEPIFEAGLLPRLVEILDADTSVELRREVCRLITIGCFVKANAVVDAGAVPVLVRLINTEDDRLRDQCMWTIATLAGYTPSVRDIVLKHGALEPLLLELNRSRTMTSTSNAGFALMKCCSPLSEIHHKSIAKWWLANLPKIDMGTFQRILPLLSSALNHQDREVVTCACLLFTNLLHIDHSARTAKNRVYRVYCLRFQAVLKSGVLPTIVELLRDKSASTFVPAADFLCSLLKGDADHLKAVFESAPNLVPLLGQLKSFRSKS